MGDLDKKSMEAAIDAVYFWADGDARQIAEGVVKAYLAASPSPQTHVMALKADVEAAFRRHIEAAPYAKDVLKRLAFEVVPMITAALATEGKDND